MGNRRELGEEVEMCFRDSRQTARELVIRRLAAYRSEPSEQPLRLLKEAVESWLMTMEAADPSGAGMSKVNIS